MTAAVRMSRDEAKILAHYAAGETVRRIAAATGSTSDDVQLAIDALADGNRQRAHDLVIEWQDRARAVVAAQGKALPAPVGAVTTVTEAAQDSANDLIADLLNRAAATEVPRLVQAAERISDLVDQLEQLVKAHEQEQALRDEAERLEARLADIRQRLGSARRLAPSSSDDKRIREWAVENNVTCSMTGRVSKAVREAYMQATGGGKAGARVVSS